MKEYLHELAEQADDVLARGCVVREYLQARILESLQDQGLFLEWAFLGGTALRFLYGIPRFSEDLDFSLILPGHDTRLRSALAQTGRMLEREGYRTEMKISDRKTVASAFVRFPGLPFELGFSPHPSQTLSVKVDVDSNPPPGARVETTLIRRHVLLHLCHYDKASLFAGKLHAILSRSWPKGRDLYDLAWYLADRIWPAPNLDLLNNALAQTGWTGPHINAKNWREEVRKRIKTLDWDAAQSDVRPFLARQSDLELVTQEVIGGLLQ